MRELSDVLIEAIRTASDRDPAVTYGHKAYLQDSQLAAWSDTIIRELRDAAKTYPGILEPLLHDD